jgi:hypothetical protein
VDDYAAADGHRLTDAGNAARLVELAGGKLRYVHAWGRWIIYSGGTWVIDANDALVTEQAKRVATKLFKMSILLEGDDRKKVFGWATKSESSNAISTSTPTSSTSGTGRSTYVRGPLDPTTRRT